MCGVRPGGLPAGAPHEAVAATDGSDVFVRQWLQRVPTEFADSVLLHELAHVRSSVS